MVLSVYLGNFCRDRPHGMGTEINVFKDSSISHYEVNYDNNLRNGHGTHHWKNEFTYNGPFLKGYKHTRKEEYGTLTWKEDSK